MLEKKENSFLLTKAQGLEDFFSNLIWARPVSWKVWAFITTERNMMMLWEIAQWRSRSSKPQDRSRPNGHDGSDATTADILIGPPT
jgi:hypothetical protein